MVCQYGLVLQYYWVKYGAGDLVPVTSDSANSYLTLGENRNL